MKENKINKRTNKQTIIDEHEIYTKSKLERNRNSFLLQIEIVTRGKHTKHNKKTKTKKVSIFYKHL